MAVAFEDSSRVVSSVHGGEVEHCHVGLAVVVHREVKVGQLALGGEVGGLSVGLEHSEFKES